MEQVVEVRFFARASLRSRSARVVLTNGGVGVASELGDAVLIGGVPPLVPADAGVRLEAAVVAEASSKLLARGRGGALTGFRGGIGSRFTAPVGCRRCC